MQTIELLAPAKDLATGIAAIDHGADAVYIGASHHGARAAAGNNVGDIAALCAYAHKFMARVYVTINTIVYDDELADVRKLLCQLADAKADAILIQDMAIVKMIGEAGNDSRLAYFRHRMHASTQTDNRSADKVAWLRDCGMVRAVLARELSIEEISHIHKSVPDIELEAFVHGALCVSYSGLCYASQCVTGRSANRGECAQVCRMKFDLVDASGNTIEHGRHLLSLKDSCQIDNLEKMMEAGITSFKIEGRLKDIPYVKNVVAAYNQQIEQIMARSHGKYRRLSLGKCKYTFTPDLQKTFNRGYTTYFANGRTPAISSPETPKAKGKPVGTVKEVRRNHLTIAGIESFANGDGLCFINGSGELEGFRANKVEGNKIFPLKMPHGLHPGTTLFRNSDKAFESLLAAKSAERRIRIGMHLTRTPDGIALTASCNDGPCATATMPMSLAEALKPQHDNIVNQLKKLGNTIFECPGADIEDGLDKMFIPSSRLSELRRMATDSLEKRLADNAAVHECTVMNKPHANKVPTDIYGAHTYFYNIANDMARDFYKANGLDRADAAYELRKVSGAMVMQCRHCLRFALGKCVKNGGTRPTWKEPLTLKLENGKSFTIEFDCKHCQMNIYDKSS